MVPPAFAEVWQLMFQGVFNHFKHDADHSAQPPVAKYQCLQQHHTLPTLNLTQLLSNPQAIRKLHNISI